uniref:Uncharacterized protein n=1 Tax=Cannabis sativa TaxID=3483 RepID=A0A803QRL9_CANSA
PKKKLSQKSLILKIVNFRDKISWSPQSHPMPSSRSPSSKTDLLLKNNFVGFTMLHNIPAFPAFTSSPILQVRPPRHHPPTHPPDESISPSAQMLTPRQNSWLHVGPRSLFLASAKRAKVELCSSTVPHSPHQPTQAMVVRNLDL